MKTKTRAFYLLVNEIDKINLDLLAYIKTFSRFSYLFLLITLDCIKFKTINFYKSNLCKDTPAPRLELIKSITKRLEEQNIVYIKIFQSFCLEQNILSNDEKDYLIKYIDNVPFNTDEIDYDLLDKLNKQFNIEIYVDQPINSGIIGVVFPGVILSKKEKEKEKVVIKMLKKNIKSKLTNLFEEIELITKLLQWIPYINQLNLNKFFQDNKQLILNQTDFMKEAENIEIFKFKIQNMTEYKIPKVYKEITNEFNNIIVMENIKGITICDLVKYDENICDIFGKILLKFGFISILMTSAIHLDLHAGNVFFYINNDSCLPKYQIGFIDFGLCSFPSRENQNIYYLFFHDLVYKKDFSNLEKINKILRVLIEEKNIFDNLSSDNKDKLIKECINCLKKSLDKLDINFIINLSKIFKKYNLNYSTEFNQICLSLHSCDTLGELLCKDLNDTVLKSFNEIYNINTLIEI
jgi:predicted unusual protein kinase regulating ubiquinone biosynthesis (AarF/ABC1/UbiB family)